MKRKPSDQFDSLVRKITMTIVGGLLAVFLILFIARPPWQSIFEYDASRIPIPERLRTESLGQRLVNSGELIGRSRTEIERVLGPPQYDSPEKLMIGYDLGAAEGFNIGPTVVVLDIVLDDKNIVMDCYLYYD